MCGIAGFSKSLLKDCVRKTYSVDADKDYSNLMSACEMISHRGPDDSGVFYDFSEGIGLVHTRLSILDLSQLGHQPMTSDDGLVTIIYNGEIYNFLELREELEGDGVCFVGNSDSEVLLQLYIAQGQEFATMLHRLNGIFSLAIWDKRDNKLVIARDAFGVKPVYILEQKDSIAFGSEIKALIPFMEEQVGTSDIDAESLLRYSTYLWCPGDGTPLKSIKKLGPGEFIEVVQGQITSREVWYQLPLYRGVRPSLGKTEALKGTVEHLRKAVHRQLVADVPVGAFLSGGLDSSSIVALAKEQISDIQCFTIETTGGQEEGFSDDLPYAHKVAAHLDVALEVVTVDSDDMAASLENMVSQLDEPLADPAPLNVLFISQLAREQGIKVLLSGAGGDDLFTGYRRHYAEQVMGWLSRMPSSITHKLHKYSSRLDQRVPTFRRLAKFFDVAALGNDERIAHYFSWIRRHDLISLYTPAMFERLNSVRADSIMLDFLANAPSESSSLERMLSLDQRFFLTDHNLTYTDKMSMAMGVEVRVPFLDLELVEFVAKIPDQYKQRASMGKWVLKKAMEPYLPHDVIYRSKSGFGAPLRRWMRFELRELLGDLLSEESLHKRGIFDPISVQQLIKNNDDGVVDASYTLLSLLCIEIWCRQFLDRQFNYQIVYGRNR